MFFQNRPYGVQTVIITFQNRLQDTFRDSVCVDCQGRRHAGMINSGDFFDFYLDQVQKSDSDLISLHEMTEQKAARKSY